MGGIEQVSCGDDRGEDRWGGVFLDLGVSSWRGLSLFFLAICTHGFCVGLEGVGGLGSVVIRRGPGGENGVWNDL